MTANASSFLQSVLLIQPVTIAEQRRHGWQWIPSFEGVAKSLKALNHEGHEGH